MFRMYEAISVTNVSVVFASVTGFVEQKFKYWVSSDYLFVLEVFWSDRSTTYIKRSYTDFLEFHASLCDHFKAKYDYGGIKTSVYIPQVQGKRFFQRNCIELAERRELQLNDFVKQLLQGNPLISSNNIVLGFFRSRSTDPIPNRGPPDGACREDIEGAFNFDDNGDEDEDDVLFNKD